MLTSREWSKLHALELLDEIARLRAALSEATREIGCDNCGSHMPAASSVEHGSEMWCCRCAADDELRAENEQLRAARLRPETVRVIRRALLGEITAAWTPEDADSLGLAIDDIDRCYPEEE